MASSPQIVAASNYSLESELDARFNKQSVSSEPLCHDYCVLRRLTETVRPIKEEPCYLEEVQ